MLRPTRDETSVTARFFSRDSAGRFYVGSMPATNSHKKRFLELTQLLLAFVGTCGVADTTIPHGTHSRPGYSASIPIEATTGDRRFADLARTERRRREALQLASRRPTGNEVAATRRL